MKQLIILAGGKGTRLQERLGSLPKPLIDICGKPLLEHQVLLAKEHGFTDIIITIHHQANYIREFCGNGDKWAVNIRYLEETRPLGSAGAVIQHIASLADRFMVMYGDTMLDVDLSRFLNSHIKRNVDASIFLHPNDHPHDSDIVETALDGLVTAFHPYPHPDNIYLPNLVNASLYVVEKSALLPYAQLSIPDKGIDFAKQLFPLMLERGQRIYGYNSTEYIKDAGTPKRIDQVCCDVQNGKISRRSLRTPRPAIFIDRDGTVTQQTHYVKSVDELHLLPNAAESIRRINESGRLAILVTNQPVIARGDCTEEELKQIHNKLETMLGQEGAYLDAIFYCPHHPQKGFPGERPEFKVACECRKPGIDMLRQACEFTNIAMHDSWFIGDTSVDMLTAKNAGIKSMLVRTGCGGCDDAYAARPDFEAYHLSDAVSFILEKYPLYLQNAREQTSAIRCGEWVVIGGLARSGKSTWASLMKIALAERGIPCAIISLDGWIKDINERGDGDMHARHDLEGIKQFVDSLRGISGPVERQIPSYNRQKRSRNREVETIVICPEHVILFEGVSAFLLEELLQSAAHHYYICASDVFRMDNFRREYRLRGLSEREITELYHEREKDENHLLMSRIDMLDVTRIEGD